MIARSDFASCNRTRKSASGLGDFSMDLIGFGSVFISSQCWNPCLNDQCLQLYNSISCQLHNYQNASIECILCNGHKHALDIFTFDSSRFPCMLICYLIAIHSETSDFDRNYHSMYKLNQEFQPVSWVACCWRLFNMNQYLTEKWRQ
jgi:hypothetical protein